MPRRNTRRTPPGPKEMIKDLRRARCDGVGIVTDSITEGVEPAPTPYALDHAWTVGASRGIQKGVCPNTVAGPGQFNSPTLNVGALAPRMRILARVIVGRYLLSEPGSPGSWCSTARMFSTRNNRIWAATAGQIAVAMSGPIRPDPTERNPITQ
ncbi:hypothetical protein BDW59DRAFT_168223 [Aspergillus cavernicola]|uniref:Uncharacterized protein n=1 Tax=Aspergillus cavernicola TaxID=176166 RepID=A0ABR4H2C6_9EURO